MLSKHCDKILVTVTDNKRYFRKRCTICGKTYKQRKRQPASK